MCVFQRQTCRRSIEALDAYIVHTDHPTRPTQRALNIRALASFTAQHRPCIFFISSINRVVHTHWFILSSPYFGIVSERRGRILEIRGLKNTHTKKTQVSYKWLGIAYALSTIEIVYRAMKDFARRRRMVYADNAILCRRGSTARDARVSTAGAQGGTEGRYIAAAANNAYGNGIKQIGHSTQTISTIYVQHILRRPRT